MSAHVGPAGTNDPVGRWFAAMEAYGDPPRIYARHRRDGRETWHESTHARLDGVAFVHHVAKIQGERVVRLGTRPPRPAPSRWGRARLAARQVTQRPPAPCSILGYRPEATGPSVSAILSYTREETAAVRAAAARARTSANARLLHAWDAAMSARYADDRPSVWMVPVDMRHDVPVPDEEEGNYIGMLNVAVPRRASGEQVQAALRERLERQEHWAIWDLWRLAPDRAVARATAREYAGGLRRTGLFSNLGRWEGDADEWCALPLVSRPAPFGVVVIEWNGRLVVTAEAHAAVGADEATVSAWLEEMRRIALG